MVLVQDQYSQSRKNFDNELQLKQDTSKQYYTEPKEFWEIESACEEVLSSGNDSEAEDILYAEPSDIQEEVLETRRPRKKSPKNVRFEGRDFNCVLDTSETSSVENEYAGIDCGYSLQEPEIVSHKTKEHFRVPHRPKCRTAECVFNKKYGCERRPKSNPEKSSSFLESSFLEKRPISLGDCGDPADSRQRLRRKKEHRCGRIHHDDATHEVCRRHKPFKSDYGDESFMWQHHGDCCDHRPTDDIRPRSDKKNYVTMKPMYKHDIHRKARIPHYDTQFAYYATEKYYPEECHEHGYSSKSKKKILEAVQEQQEQFSDSTYKVPCNKYSTQTIPLDNFGTGYPVKSSEKLTNSSQSDWLCCGLKSGEGFGEKLRETPPRIHKMRSRRTRMNRLKNGWKKAFVQTVRDGTRNERVGVLVMGSKGPEFYAKNSKNSTGPVPFRKSNSFLEGSAKSFEVMTIDCKNVFLSSSEPGQRTGHPNNDLISPEDDAKMEEKIAKFSKNVNDIVKSSEEKFYKALSNDYQGTKKPIDGIFKGAGEGIHENKKDDTFPEESSKSKFSSYHLTLDPSSPRVPKSLKKSEKKVNEKSKAMAEALNEQAKQFKENLKDREDTFLDDLKELQKKFPPKELSQETVEANLSLWGMKLEELTEKTELEDKQKETEKKVEDTRIEESQSGSVKSTEQISMNKQRRKKYYETTGRKMQDDSCAGDAPVITDKSEQLGSSKLHKRTSKLKKWTESPNVSFETASQDTNLISTVFRDLVENGCAISSRESANLQGMFNRPPYNPGICSHDASSSSSSEIIQSVRESRTNCLEEEKSREETEAQPVEPKKNEVDDESKNQESDLEEVNSRKVLKMKNYFEEKVSEPKVPRKVGRLQREGKSKRKILTEDKMRLFREALPSITAENEAAHLKQLKKYIDRFIDRVEASTTSEFRKRKEIRLKSKESASTDSGEVKVDARKILEFVSSPFKKISSDVTINIAKKLTDALVQEKSSKGPKPFGKGRKSSEVGSTDEDFPVVRGASSGSDRCEESEPTYLKQLKKMRNEHLNNIVQEVKRLSELLRFLDRCNRLKF